MLIDQDGLEECSDGVGLQLVDEGFLFVPEVVNFRRVDEEGLKFYLGDYGQTLYIYVGTPLERATNFFLKARKPDGEEVHWGVVISEREEYLECRINLGALDQVGIWHLQAYVKLDSWVGLGETVEFEVCELFN